MTKVRYLFMPLAFAAAACTPPASEPTQAGAAGSPVPADIAALVSAAAPDVTITSGELSPGNNQYEVTGTLPNGDEIEVDMVRSDGAWAVLEIQRDVAWPSVPEPVRAAAADVPNPFEPVRVIESTQVADSSIVYELFRPVEVGSQPRGPDLEVRWYEGSAEVIP